MSPLFPKRKPPQLLLLQTQDEPEAPAETEKALSYQSEADETKLRDLAETLERKMDTWERAPYAEQKEAAMQVERVARELIQHAKAITPARRKPASGNEGMEDHER